MPQVIDWPRAAEPRSVLQQAARALRRGGLVAVPTETGPCVAACALDADAVGALAAAAGEANPVLPLGLADPGAAADWVADLGPLGRRLARRCWPGPVTLAFEGAGANGLAARLPEGVRRAAGNGSLALRVPYHPAARGLIERLAVPVVLADAPPRDRWADLFGERLGLVLDDPSCDGSPPATVLRVNGSAWSLLRPGALTEEDVARQSACLIVFVCTGNTCRSPMAEALCKRLLADRLGCPVEELPGRGYLVISAGVSAVRGEPAPPEAVEAVRPHGADLSRHASRPAHPDLLRQADHLIAMTQSHLMTLAHRCPELGCRPRLLCGDDLPDPVG